MFEWNHDKNESNKKKHGISFDEVVLVFRDEFALVKEDPDHPDERFIILGVASFLMVVVVSYTYRREAIRIISARKATKRERKVYEEHR